MSLRARFCLLAPRRGTAGAVVLMTSFSVGFDIGGEGLSFFGLFSSDWTGFLFLEEPERNDHVIKTNYLIQASEFWLSSFMI